MPEAARLVVAGWPHHVVQRGLRSVNVFEDDADREAYLGFLAGAAEAFGQRDVALQMGIRLPWPRLAMAGWAWPGASRSAIVLGLGGRTW